MLGRRGSKSSLNSESNENKFVKYETEIATFFFQKYGEVLAKEIFTDMSVELYNRRYKPAVDQKLAEIDELSAKVKNYEDTIKSLENKLKEKEAHIRNVKTENHPTANQSLLTTKVINVLDEQAKHIQEFHGNKFDKDLPQAAVDLIRFLDDLDLLFQSHELENVDKLRIVKRKLKDDALQLYDYSKPLSYEEFVTTVRDRYLDANRLGESLEQQVDNMKRLPGQNVLSFGMQIGKLSRVIADLSGYSLSDKHIFKKMKDVFLAPFRYNIRRDFSVAQAIESQDFDKLIRSVDIALRGDPSFSENKGLNVEIPKVLTLRESSKVIKCNFCNRLGHIERDCFLRFEELKKKKRTAPRPPMNLQSKEKQNVTEAVKNFFRK